MLCVKSRWKLDRYRRAKFELEKRGKEMSLNDCKKIRLETFIATFTDSTRRISTGRNKAKSGGWNWLESGARKTETWRRKKKKNTRKRKDKNRKWNEERIKKKDRVFHVKKLITTTNCNMLFQKTSFPSIDKEKRG